MKRFTLLITSLLLFGLAFGQMFKPSTSIIPYGSTEKKWMIPEESRLKSEGTVFYSETFNWKDASEPRGWKLPAGWQIVDETDLGTPWVWRAGTDSIKGHLTFEPGHIYSKTPEDGYFVFPMDEYNFQDNVITDKYATTWFQLPSIDCSSHPTVVFKMRQYFRCNPTVGLTMSVSNDQGAHWASYSLAYETVVNIFCKNPFVEINITDVAAGMSDVWIKFTWTNMRMYFWCVDDIELSEAYNNEIQLEKPWLLMTDLEEDGDEGFNYMVPASQVGTDGFGGYTFKAGFLNAGRDDQENCYLNTEVFKNGVSVYNKNSEARDIWALQRDTFPITDQFVPDGYGNYEMVLTAKQKATDGLPGNNVYRDTYYITDSVYSISDWNFETYTSTAGFGNNDGDYLGVEYDLKKKAEVNSISTLIMQRPENHTASTKPGFSFQYWIFWYEEIDGVWIELLSSEYIEVTQEMLDKWITLPLQKDGESEFLEPGKYIAAIQVFHGGGLAANNAEYRFTIGCDNSHRQSVAKSVYRVITNVDNAWVQNRDIAMIRMNINNIGAPKMADVNFNVDMTLPIANGYFKPASDYVDVAGTFNGWNGSANHLTDADGDGIYTGTVSGLPTFEKIEYKYRINGDWNTSEFPSGGANRNYRITYYNMLNDVYNNGASMGLNVNSLNSFINVYPNPSDGEFTLSVSNTQVQDLTILVTNIQGQTVYQNQVKSVLDHQVNIDLGQFAKGMYFLKVNNQVTKLLIK